MDFRFSEFPNCTIKFYGKVELFIGLHHSTVQALALSAGLLLFTKKIIENVLPSKNQTSNVQIRKLTRFVLEEVMLIILDVNAYQEPFETNLISIFHDYAPTLFVVFIY